MSRPTWAEISSGNLLSNYAYLCSLAADQAELLAVVKADAYGHGLAHCAPLLARAGAAWLGVTSVEEGVRARALCADTDPRILIMSGIWRGEAEAALEYRLTPVVWEDYHLDLIESAAHKLGLDAQSVGVHLEIDTGMSRQGVQAPETKRAKKIQTTNADSSASLATRLLRFHADSPLKLEGIMTHFSAPEDAHSDATTEQLQRLSSALDLVMVRSITPQWLHAGNSATLIGRDAPTIDTLRSLAEKIGAGLMLRPGLALYGYAPRFTPGKTQQQLAAEAACQPVLRWKTRIVSLRALAIGETVGYNSTFHAARPTRVALLPVGYADGLNRRLSNCGKVLVRGSLAPIVGRISMDQTVIDVTDIAGVEIGDEVVIIGAQQGERITAYDHADLAHTIPWEILCDIGARVPRKLME